MGFLQDRAAGVQPLDTKFHNYLRMYRNEPVALYSVAFVFKLGGGMQERGWYVVRGEQKRWRVEDMVGARIDNSGALGWGGRRLGKLEGSAEDECRDVATVVCSRDLQCGKLHTWLLCGVSLHSPM
jgi:hypothetical protein